MVKRFKHEVPSHQKFTLCAKFGAVFAGLLLPVTWFAVVQEEYVTLAPPHITPSKLMSYSEKLEFTSKYFVLIGIWIAINVLLVAIQRSWTNRLNPTEDGSTPEVDKWNQILRNSIEQSVLVIVTQMALLSYLDGNLVLKLVPLVNIGWFVGRLLFAIGYPMHRGFGWILNYYLTLTLLTYAIYNFGRFYQLY